MPGGLIPEEGLAVNDADYAVEMGKVFIVREEVYQFGARH